MDGLNATARVEDVPISRGVSKLNQGPRQHLNERVSESPFGNFPVANPHERGTRDPLTDPAIALTYTPTPITYSLARKAFAIPNVKHPRAIPTIAPTMSPKRLCPLGSTYFSRLFAA